MSTQRTCDLCKQTIKSGELTVPPMTIAERGEFVGRLDGGLSIGIGPIAIRAGWVSSEYTDFDAHQSCLCDAIRAALKMD